MGKFNEYGEAIDLESFLVQQQTGDAFRKLPSDKVAHSFGFTGADEGKIPQIDPSGNIVWIGGGGGMTHLDTQTVAAGASIVFTSGFSATYDHYIFDFFGVYPATDNDSFYAQISVDGGSSWLNTGYYTSTGYMDTTTVDADPASSDSATRWNILSNADSTALGAVYGRMHLYVGTTLAVASGQVQSLNSSSAATRNTIFGGRKVTASRANAIRFVMALGNETGTIRMYGVANS